MPQATPATPPARPEEAPDPDPGPVQIAAVAKPAIGFVPPEERGSEVAAEPAEPSEATGPPPVPSREEVMEDARREADRIEAERQRLE